MFPVRAIRELNDIGRILDIIEAHDEEARKRIACFVAAIYL